MSLPALGRHMNAIRLTTWNEFETQFLLFPTTCQPALSGTVPSWQSIYKLQKFFNPSAENKSCFAPHTAEPHLSELAGRLVTGLKIDTRSKQQYNRYTRPTLNGVNKSKVLHTKCPPRGEKANGSSRLTKESFTLLYYLCQAKTECFNKGVKIGLSCYLVLLIFSLAPLSTFILLLLPRSICLLYFFFLIMLSDTLFS